MPSSVPDIQPAIDRLVDCGPLKTWSVVVTILGDLLRDPADRIHGRSLAALTGPMGIADPALRVALHRLKKDGWIESARDGRESLYWLSDVARGETERVRERIYGRSPADVGNLRLILLPADADPFEDNRFEALTIAPRLVLTNAAETPPEALQLPMPAPPFPDWLTDQLCAPDHRHEFRRLSASVDATLATTLPTAVVPCAILRMLILHQWRRLHLRHSAIADAVLPPDWDGARARQAVIRGLHTLPRPSLADLAAAPRL